MAQQTSLTSDVENLQVVESTHEVNRQQTYRRPEVIDLGKASELLQGGGHVGKDSSNLTYAK